MTVTMSPVDYDVFQHLRKLLIAEMELDSERVNLYDQKFIIPNDERLFVVIERGPSKVISSRNSTRDDGNGGFEEVQDVNTADQYTVGLFSRNLDALNRKEEVVMALGSVYAQQLQEQYSFFIAPLSPIVDASALEGAAMLYRFDVAVTVFSYRQKVKTVDFYDSFTGRVRVNDAQPDMVVDFVQPTE